jgi:hypothetical protein
MSEEGDDLAALIGRKFNAATSVAERRVREARPMSRAARGRLAKGRIKTEQVNMRVSPGFKKLLMSLAHHRGVSMVELIEIAVERLQETDA